MLFTNVYIWLLNHDELDTPAIDETYQVDNQMLITVINLVYRLKRDCYFCDVALLVYSLYMYNKFSGDIYIFAYCEAAMILFLGFIQYLILSAKSKFINKAAIEVRLSEQYIDIKTASFNGPLWFKKESEDIRLNRVDTAIKQIANPYPKIFKQSKQVTRLAHKGTNVYIINSYFNPQLQERLQLA